jgi:hypothetical protein
LKARFGYQNSAVPWRDRGAKTPSRDLAYEILEREADEYPLKLNFPSLPTDA